MAELVLLAGAVAAGAAGATIAGSAAVAATLGLGVTGAIVAGAVASTAIGFGTSLVARELQSAPRVNASSSGSVADAAVARWNILGQCRTAGSFLLYDVSPANELWSVIVVACHPIEGIVEHRLDDEVVTLDEDGWVQTPDKWKDLVQIQVKDGSHSTAFGDVVSAFSYWTSDHKGLGLAQVAIRQKPVKRTQFARLYPGAGHLLRYACVLKGRADLFDPRDDSTGWSANAALNVLGHLRRDTLAGGLGIPDAMLDLPSFAAAATVCAQPVALKAGGTEPRYRVGGVQVLTDSPREVLRALLNACDADLYLTGAGKIAIRIGFDAAGADETMTEDHIIGMTWRPGRGGIERKNRVVATYTSADHGYQQQTTPAFDAPLAAGEPRRPAALALPYVGSGTQAQRLAKRHLQMLTAPWQVTAPLTLAGLALAPTGPVKFASDAAQWSGDMRVVRRTLAAALDGVTIEAVAKPDGYGDWDAETDEQDVTPQPALDATDGILVAPTITSASVVAVLVDGETKGARIEVAYSALSDDTVDVQIEHSVAGEGEWSETRTRQDATRGALRTEILDDGGSYDVRIRFLGPGGGVTEWAVEEGVEVTAETIPPGEPTEMAAVASGTDVTLSARAPQDDYHARLRFFSSATDDFATASPVGTVKGPPGDVRAITLTGLADGTYYAWAVSRNASGVQGDETASASFSISVGA